MLIGLACQCLNEHAIPAKTEAQSLNSVVWLPGGKCLLVLEIEQPALIPVLTASDINALSSQIAQSISSPNLSSD